MRIFWWSAVILWLAALSCWFQQVLVLMIARNEVEFSVAKIFVFLFLWITIICSYFNAIFTPPDKIPDEYHVNVTFMTKREREETLRDMAKKLKVHEVNYCETCRVLKPNRAHHCRKCNKCMLRMDHHCPVLQSCVRHSNHKFYMLYLFWPCMLAIFVLFITAPYIYNLIKTKRLSHPKVGAENSWIITAISNAIGILITVVYLMRYQVQAILRNRTMIEEAEVDDLMDENDDNAILHIYDLGSRYANFCSVFGSRPWKWLLPYRTSEGDGVAFEWKKVTIKHIK